jgi:hypothetical protein
LFLVALTAWAAPAPAPVVLDSVEHADTYARKLVADIKANPNVKGIELYHVGNEPPPETEVILRWLNKEGIPARFHKIDPKELDRMLDEQSKTSAELAPTLYQLIRYENEGPAAANSPETKQEKLKLADRVREIKARINHFFGVPGGVSFLVYKIKRSVAEKLVEAGVGFSKVAVTSVVMYQAIKAKELSGADMNMVLPLAVSAAYSLVFDYWQRGNNAFKGQGVNYDFREGKYVMNRKFYLMVAFLHSLIVRESIMAAAHWTGAGFTMGWHDAFAAFCTSMTGLLGKAPFEMAITRGQKTHGKWWTIGWMTAWSTFYASLQILDLFQVGPVFRMAFTGLGITGLGVELYKDRFAIVRSFRQATDWILRRRRMERCETLLATGKDPQP